MAYNTGNGINASASFFCSPPHIQQQQKNKQTKRPDD
jgi:hypothetical protein